MPDPITHNPPRTIRVPDAEWEQVEQYRKEEGLPSRNAFFLWLLARYRKNRERERREG